MASLKNRMNAFQKASTKVTPKKEKIDIPKSGKINMKFNPFAKKQSAAVVTPDGKTPPKKKIDIFEKGKQDQDNRTEKAKTASIEPASMKNQNWSFLYELSIQFDNLKAQEADEVKNSNAQSSSARHVQGDKKSIRSSLESSLGGSFTANGSFLTNEFIGKHLVEDKKYKSLTFNFTTQSSLFKRFDRKDDEQRKICAMFVDAIVKHPRSSEITALQMANCLLPDEFLKTLANKCIKDPKSLSNLMVINMESNFLEKEGIIALADAIDNPKVWPRLQILKLENQKRQTHNDAETALGEAILKSPSLVVVSLRVRDGLAKQQIDNTVKMNIDNIREARQNHAKKSGTLKPRKRNEMEQMFDKIAQNDTSIAEVDIVGDIKYLGLKVAERTKTAEAFATNTHVKTVKMVKLKLDDAFAEAFGKAIARNATLEKVIIDSNDFSGTGIKALFEGLGQNSSIVEFQVRHQSKKTSSADEQALPPLLAPNKTIIKLGVDLRDQMAKMQIDRKLNETREHQRKLRAAAKKR